MGRTPLVVLALLLAPVAACVNELATRRDAGVAFDVGDAALRDARALDATGDGAVPDAAEPATDAGATGCPRLGAWTSSAPWGDGTSHPLPSFAVGGRFYVHTQSAGGRELWYAEPQPDGTLGPWLSGGDHGGGPHGFTAVVADGAAYHFRNGHIARYRFLPGGALDGDVELLEDSRDTAFGGNLYVWDDAVTIRLGGADVAVAHLGGFSFAGYAYRPHVYVDALPLGPRFSPSGSFPATRPGRAAFFPAGPDHGWVIATENGSDRILRARFQAGVLGAFEEVGALPSGTGNQRGDIVQLGCSLVVVRGASVFVADVVDGALGAFAPAPSLPEDQIDVSWGDGHQEGASFGVLAGHLYLTGPRVVFSAPIL